MARHLWLWLEMPSFAVSVINAQETLVIVSASELCQDQPGGLPTCWDGRKEPPQLCWVKCEPICDVRAGPNVDAPSVETPSAVVVGTSPNGCRDGAPLPLASNQAEFWVKTEPAWDRESLPDIDESSGANVDQETTSERLGVPSPETNQATVWLKSEPAAWDEEPADISDPLSPEQSALPTPALATQDETLDRVLRIIQNSIASGWMAMRITAGIQLFEITSCANCQVKRSVLLSDDGSLGIFIHQRPLPASHPAWASSANLPSLLASESADQVAAVVSDVLARVSGYVCPGNFEETYRYLWLDEERYRESGVVETGLVDGCAATFRVSKCTLLSDKAKCDACLAFRRALASQHSRANAAQETGSGKSAEGQGQGEGGWLAKCRPNTTLSLANLRLKLAESASRIRKLNDQAKAKDKRIKDLIDGRIRKGRGPKASKLLVIPPSEVP